MTTAQATALATRLAEGIWIHPLNSDDFNMSSEDMAAAMLPLLQAQAVEDQREFFEATKTDGSWLDKWGSCRVCGGEIPHGHSNNCDLYKMEQTERALRALVGRMTTAMGNLRDARGRHNSGIAYERLLEVLQEADNLTAPSVN